jgi:hypothetical protein
MKISAGGVLSKPITLLAAMLVIAIGIPAHAMKPLPKKPAETVPAGATAPDAPPVTEVEAATVSEDAVDVLVDQEKKEDDEGGMPPVIEPPHFARYKKPMPDILLRNKKEGFYVTPFPVIAWDPDTKFNIGASAAFFQNGKKESPFFRITPYVWQLQTTAVVSSGGVFLVQTYYDQLYVADTPWRVRGELDVYRNPFTNYFGIGNDGQQLIFPGTGQVFGSYPDYQNALDQQQGGFTNERYDTYDHSRVVFRGTAEYSLLGGYIRPLFGIQVSRVWIEDYTGDTVSGAIQNQTHLAADCASGRTIGCNGGWDNLVKLGISFDTRDFEPNPKQGVFWELTTELSPKFLGSAYNYGRLTTDIRAYGNIIDWKNQLMVLAGRFYYGWQFGDVPFYSMNTMSFTDRNYTGLGGYPSIRGYRLDRYIGPVQMLANVELRWSFYDFTVFRQNIMLGLKPFLDIGRTFDSNSDITFAGWHPGGGVGLMLAWNLSTVINFDMAWSSEGRAFYMEAGLQF